MAKNQLTDVIRGILTESGPDQIPGRASLDLSYDEVGGPITSADAGKLDYAKSIKAGQGKLPNAGGAGPEKNPSKYKKVEDIDPKKDLGEEEEEDDEKDDVKEDDSRLPSWLKAKSKKDDSDDSDEDDEKKDDKDDVKEERDDKDEKGEDDGDEDDEKEVNEEYFESRYAEADRLTEESFNSLFEGKKLSEDFKNKLATVFESTINLRMDVIKEHFEAIYEVQLDKKVKDITESLTTTVNSYLTMVAEEWLQENAVQVERGIKSELVEDFIVELKSLFEKHYIEVPEKKVDVVEALAERVDELTEQLNRTLNNNVSLNEELTSLKKKIAISEASTGLVDSKASKFRKLAENIDYSDKFTEQLEVLKESIATGTSNTVKKTTLTEEADSAQSNQNTNKQETRSNLVEEVLSVLDPSRNK